MQIEEKPMAIKDEKKHSEKDIKKLCWDYLKRSDNFKEFCEKRHELEVDYFGECYSPLVEYYKYFGNIFEQEFDDWWNGSRRNRWKSIGSYPVRDLQGANPKDIRSIIKSEPEYIIMAIPIAGKDDMASIARQIKKIRDHYKKTPAAKDVEKRLRRFIMPSTRIRYDELKLYLEVYDLKEKGLKMREVIKEIKPRENEKDVDIRREFNRFYSNAKTIIENVEKGYFPGKY
jgi:hypothetical protein